MRFDHPANCSRADGLFHCVCLSHFLPVNIFAVIHTHLTLNVSSHWGENLAWWSSGSWEFGFEGQLLDVLGTACEIRSERRQGCSLPGLLQ